MRSFRMGGLAAGMVVAASVMAGGASAAPASAGLSAVSGPEMPATQVQYGYGYGYGPGYYGGPRPYYGGPGYGPGYGFYGPPGYRRRVVCRIRPTPYGPREVCFRR